MAYSKYFNHLHPVLLIKGHDYELSFKGGKKLIYKFIKTSPKGYKFYNEKMFQCRPRFVLFPMKNKDGSKKETWFLLPDCMEIIDVTPVALKEYLISEMKELYHKYYNDTMGGGSGSIYRSIIEHMHQVIKDMNIDISDSVDRYNPHHERL